MDPEIRYLMVLVGGALVIASCGLLHILRLADNVRVGVIGRPAYDSGDARPASSRMATFTVLGGFACMAIGFLLGVWMYEGALLSHEENERVLNGIHVQPRQYIAESPWAQIQRKREQQKH